MFLFPVIDATTLPDETKEAPKSLDIGVVMIGVILVSIGLLIFIDLVFLVKQTSPTLMLQEMKNYFAHKET